MSELDLGPAAAIPEGGSKGYHSGSELLFAVKKGGEIYLYRNSCPHVGIPLEWVPDRFLDPSGALIQCANHGAQFTIEDGHCVAGPCRGQALEAIAYTLRDGHLFAQIDV
ncbi:Rieske (2Fe-2S) protein [Marinimicrobium alkaliphilum]|uniref:Rieske (2Fe-2S) protein n=1 Tax=Marinimicrobium alkaliphilum TaxID=2202654 RepID=UPI000DB9D42E|nr:Rieske 2Fe-2S domain-containing protein [Marinimicrobium alkaliphilum]